MIDEKPPAIDTMDELMKEAKKEFNYLNPQSPVLNVQTPVPSPQNPEPESEHSRQSLRLNLNDIHTSLPLEIEEIQASVIACIPLTQDGTSGGPINRRLAFELCEMLSDEQAQDLHRFASTVIKMKG